MANSLPPDPAAEVGRAPGVDRRTVLAGAAGAAGLAGLDLAIRPTDAEARPAAYRRDSLRDQVALVTGAARGIGRAISLALARAGADVVALDVADPRAVPTLGYPLATRADLDRTVTLVRGIGRRCWPVVADVRDATRMRRVAAETVRRWGRLDILVANAGILPRRSLDETSDEVWADCLAVNVTGVGNVLRAAVPHMRAAGGGRVVAVASEFARHALAPERAVYTASKWAVLGLVKGAAIELTASGVLVNAVCPGFVRSGMTVNAEVYAQILPGDPTPTPGELDRAVRAQNIERNALPVGLLDPGDIAAAVLYLVGPDGRYVTGAALDVNGGFSPGITA